jgi:hypothetical protein
VTRPDENEIERVVDRLQGRFPDLRRQHIHHVVLEGFEGMRSARIRIYIPAIVEHLARGRLRRERDARTPRS